MTMEQEISDSPSDLGSRRVFLSAGIPEADWIDAPFQRHEITQAVVTVARARPRRQRELGVWWTAIDYTIDI